MFLGPQGLAILLGATGVAIIVIAALAPLGEEGRTTALAGELCGSLFGWFVCWFLIFLG